MAYSISKPSGSRKGSISSRPSGSSSYGAALEGFSSDLASLRSKILAEQSAAMDYHIEVGASSIEEKIALYETYLNGLSKNTQEWYRVAKKIEDLKDSASTQNFSLAKSLYAGGQMSGDEYYSILRERVAEEGISNREKQTRVLELRNFEVKIREDATDKAIKESLIKEGLGVISAAERYRIIQEAYNNETDPSRKATLEGQLVNQGKKVRNEELSNQELLVRKAMNEGLATTADLIPILQLKAATALTENERLSAEISIQDAMQKAASEHAAAIKQAGGDNFKYIKNIVKDYDELIEEAKRKGDMTGLYGLYDKKSEAILAFYRAEDPMTGEKILLLEEDMEVPAFENFLEEVYGKKIDPFTGAVLDVGTDADYSYNDVRTAVEEPGAIALAFDFKTGAKDASFKLVRGERIGESYVYGDYVQVSQDYVADTEKGGFKTDDSGNLIRVNTNPKLLKRDKLSDAEMVRLKEDLAKKNDKLPAGFTGEYIERQGPDGKISREWIINTTKVTDKGKTKTVIKLDNVAGAYKYPGMSENEYAVTNLNDGLGVPTEKVLDEQKMRDNVFAQINEGIVNMGVSVGARVRDAITNSGVDSPDSWQLPDTGAGKVRLDFEPINIGFDASKLSERLNKMREDITRNTTYSGGSIINQFTDSIFKSPGEASSAVFKAASNKSYAPLVGFGLKKAAGAVLNAIPGVKSTINTFKGVSSFVGNLFGKGK